MHPFEHNTEFKLMDRGTCVALVAEMEDSIYYCECNQKLEKLILFCFF